MQSEWSQRKSLLHWGEHRILNGMKETSGIQAKIPLSTFLDDCGVRALYNQVGGLFSPALIQSLLRNELYLKGPHQGGALNVNCQVSFGHYNPAAIEELVGVMRHLTGQSHFVGHTQDLYDLHLQRLVRTYYEAYRACSDYPSFLQEAGEHYQHLVARGQADFFDFGLDSQFAAFAEQELQLDWYEAETAAAFWLRRSIDSSSVAFFEGLQLLLKTYDPGYLPSRNRFTFFDSPFSLEPEAGE